MIKYTEMKNKLARGWNTWNTYSILSHVLMPEGFSLNIGLKDNLRGGYLTDALTGQYDDEEEDTEKVWTEAHEYDGSYTEIELEWKDVKIAVQSAVIDEEIVMLVKLIDGPELPATLYIQASMLWNREGNIKLDRDKISADLPEKNISIYCTNETTEDLYIPITAPFYTVRLDKSVGISTGKRRTIEEITEIINERQIQYNNRKEEFGDLSEVYNAVKNAMAWNTVYDPQNDRVISPVSRVWNYNNGYRLFCWDTYFAAYMASLDSKELAYANVREMTNEMTEAGFVPNASYSNGFKTLDRSQPPVGSIVTREIYRKFRDKWFLEEMFDDLYVWNRWFFNNRRLDNGLMAWGSDPISPDADYYWSRDRTNNREGGSLESGLDNSPMYDDVPFDQEKNILKLADVGLTGLYIMDCKALADIAEVIGKTAEAEELRRTAEESEEAIQLLWDEETGMFLNKRTDTGEFNKRISPTNFYALLSDSVTEQQAERMLKEHFYNPEEFWGEFIMPSIAKNDPAYTNVHSYWRGRIWGPMNFLVYLGLRNHHLKDACRDMADKSRKLLMKEWNEHRHIHENYSGDTGSGCEGGRSNKYYHWGALLGFISLIEEGYVESPENSLF